jgi:hypothetical protein
VITGLGGSTVWTSDINNLLPFYRDVLGLTPGAGNPPFWVGIDRKAYSLGGPEVFL